MPLRVGPPLGASPPERGSSTPILMTVAPCVLADELQPDATSATRATIASGLCFICQSSLYAPFRNGLDLPPRLAIRWRDQPLTPESPSAVGLCWTPSAEPCAVAYSRPALTQVGYSPPQDAPEFGTVADW